MCRNIKTLFNFEPPATEDEINASALQFVRKLSGFNKPSQANAAAFELAVDEVSQAARKLLTSLHTAFRETRARHPFAIDAIVVLPDHLHAIWTLPQADADFALRWRLIKSTFSRSLPRGERISQSRSEKGERGIWQRRYWEHTL